ncbi:hypothetical protein DBR11_20840 [Pedobacter sp. HMWF019]|uniref:helix-turn-helix domain-containing protein n=1 Tax=Pedobacter sp. HMWF019 TaxID=2056856 RepID=UPI000D3C40BF|nr:AraC family transcriptional regulator [Pedobacter sp. HMWF019]PTS95628.1 hypothetical protein DBR11_20840 [Pedobacter sp. HMWF019]
MITENLEIPCFQKGFIPPDAILMNNLDSLIDKHFKENKIISFYADQLFVSKKVLNSKVKRLRGKTLFELVQHRVYKEAVVLLLETDMSIKEIANELGIYDAAYFSRVFKKATGLQPKKYKEFRKANEMYFNK